MKGHLPFVATFTVQKEWPLNMGFTVTDRLLGRAQFQGYVSARFLPTTYRVPLRVADLDVEQVVQQPVDRLVFMEHEEKLHPHWQVARLEQFAWKQNIRMLTLLL